MFILLCNHKLDWTPSDYNLVYLNTRALIQISLQEREVIVLDSLEDILMLSQRSYGKKSARRGNPVKPVAAPSPAATTTSDKQPPPSTADPKKPKKPAPSKGRKVAAKEKSTKWTACLSTAWLCCTINIRILGIFCIEKCLVHIRWIYSTLQIVT